MSQLMRVIIFLATSYVVITVYHTISQPHRSPLRSIPGPWYTHITHYVLKAKTLQGRRMHYVHSLHETYGPVVRISPTQVAVADPDGFKAIHRIGSGFQKTAWYEDFAGGAGSGTGIGVGIFATCDPKAHAARRKLFARAFSAASLRQHCEDIVREKIEKTVSRIHHEATRGTSDILKWWMLMTSDVIGQLSFGESFGLVDLGKKNHYIEVLEATAIGATLQYELPWIFYACRYIPIKSARLVINAASQVNAYGGRAVANLRRHRDNHTNLFANMLAGSEAAKDNLQEDTHLLSDESIRSEASNFIVAGADTTSNTLTYIIWCILKRPMLQRRLEEELNPLGDVFDDATLEKLPLLNAVIEETLRLYGAVPGNLARVVPPSGITVGGHFIPAGYEVETQAYTLHRSPDIFPNPLQFDETRWLDPSKPTPLQKATYCPFGAGTRTCIGVHLARMQLRLGTAMLLRRCPGLKLAPGMDDSVMQMYNFFLAGPIGKRCDVTIGPGKE